MQSARGAQRNRRAYFGSNLNLNSDRDENFVDADIDGCAIDDGQFIEIIK